MYTTDTVPPGELGPTAPYTGVPYMGHRGMVGPGEELEDGAVPVEDTLRKFSCRYQSLFFVAASFVVLAGGLGALGSVFSLRLFRLINSLFLCFTGIVVGLLDLPGNPRWAARYRLGVRKYFRVFTRLTGKAMVFAVLGSLTASNMWPTDPRTSRSYSFFVVAFGLAIIGVGLLGFSVAWRKSTLLERVRREIQGETGGSISGIYGKHALSDPHMGLQQEEFNRLVAGVTGGRVSFDLMDLGIVFNALDEQQKAAIGERELREWVNGRFIFL